MAKTTGQFRSRSSPFGSALRHRDEETHDALHLGWHGFSSGLHHHHHTIEDTHIWPLMRRKLAGRPDDLAVLDDKTEHSLIDPALEALERAFGDRAADPDEVAGRIDHIVTLLQSHLAHEERDAPPTSRRLCSATKAAEQSKRRRVDVRTQGRQTAALGTDIADVPAPPPTADR